LISKNLLAVLLITALVLSATATYITITTLSVAPTPETRPANQGNVGVRVVPDTNANVGVYVLPAEQKEEK